jgi:hypothetical protein
MAETGSQPTQPPRHDADMLRRPRPRRSPLPSPAQPTGRKSLLETVPTWLQAITALLGLVVTVFGISFVANRGAQPAPGVAEVRLLSTSVGETVSGSGEYLRLRAGEEEIVLLVRLEGEQRWTPIDVSRDPTRIDDATRTEDGTWSARAPLRATTATFVPVVVNAGAMGIDDTTFEELRAEGVDASMVIASGQAVEATAAP